MATPHLSLRGTWHVVLALGAALSYACGDAAGPSDPAPVVDATPPPPYPVEDAASNADATVDVLSPVRQDAQADALPEAGADGGPLDGGPDAAVDAAPPDTTPPALAVARAPKTDGFQIVATCDEPCEVRFWVQHDLAVASWGPWQASMSVDVLAPTLLEAGPYTIKVQARDAALNESLAKEETLYVRPNRLARNALAPTLVDLPAIAARRGRPVKAMLQRDATEYLPAVYVPGDRELFEAYATGVAQRPNNWLGALGYVSGIAFDATTSGTLITSQHIVMADHYQRGVGATLVFHDAQGNPVTRTLVAKASVPGGLTPDIAVGKLDTPIPDAIQVYAVVSAAAAPLPADLTGLPYLVTDQARRVFVHTTTGPFGRRFGGTKDANLPDFMSKSLVGGDSGHATFIILGGHLVLVSTHTYAGYGNGPYYGELQNQAAIQAIVDGL
jgi:hypothetical protein